MTNSALWIVIGVLLIERALTTIQVWLIRRDPSYSRRQDRERERASSMPPPPPQRFIVPAYPEPSRFVSYGGSSRVQVAGWHCRICGRGPLARPGICPICEESEPWRPKRERHDTEPLPPK